jgi:aminopeptidase N
MVAFTAGDQSLNRNEDYLYTLFVPDRASTAFPCFDQPDLKALFSLNLEIPSNWTAVTNYSLIATETKSERKTMTFNETAPIPTYLFAFAAGKFQTAKSPDQMLDMTMYYRETDSIKVNRNLNEVFRLHQDAIDWMEEYTGIPYPFEKFDFALIPPFQYGGMEHPGSIFYRERSLFLEENATLNDRLGRASLIAHETAHIWFGDLVTMKWFDDVWSKEVFANFMADKIVNPNFQEIDHDLKFLLRHHPSAYSVDRTKGANAIRQPLDNLKNAGLMYGPIIYNKAPVMMKHLEKLSGEEKFREGMQEYLTSFAYGNADWNDLDRGRLWMQQLQITSNSSVEEIFFEDQQQKLNLSRTPDYIIVNGEGKEYGGFILDEETCQFLLSEGKNIDDDFLRGRLWLDLYETFLAGGIDSDRYYHALLGTIQAEDNPQILNQQLGQLSRIFWKFFDDKERKEVIEKTESILQDKILTSDDMGIKVSVYRAFTGVFFSNSAFEELYTAWLKESNFMDIPLSSRDFVDLSLKLALRV